MKRWLKAAPLTVLVLAAVASAALGAIPTSSPSARLSNTPLWHGQPSPLDVANAVIRSRQLPTGWRFHGGVYRIHLPIKNPTVFGQPDILAKCTNSDVRLFGPIELELIMFGPKAGRDGTFEEQIGRTAISSLADAAKEETLVSNLETACFNRAKAQGTSIATLSSPAQAVSPWDRLLGTNGVVEASQTTYRHETDTELDIVRDGYFARLIVTATQGSPATDQLLEAAVDQM